MSSACFPRRRTEDSAECRGFRKKGEKLIFMFSGQGSQYVNMGRDLYTEEPFFKETMDHCFQEFYEATGERLEDILYPDQQDEDAAAIKIQETKYAQPAIFMLEYALSLLLMKWGAAMDYDRLQLR